MPKLSLANPVRNKVSNGVNKIPRQKLILSLSIFLFLAGIYFLVCLPLIHKVSRVKLGLEEKKEMLSEAYRKKQEIEKFCQEEEIRKKKLSYFFQRIPSEEDIVPLLKDLSSLAKKQNIEEVDFKLKKEKRKEVFGPSVQKKAILKRHLLSAKKTKTQKDSSVVVYSLPIEVNVVSSYGSLISFLGDLKEIKRLVKIERMEITRKDKLSPLVKANILLSGYYASVRGETSGKAFRLRPRSEVSN